MLRPLVMTLATFFWYEGTLKMTDTPPPVPPQPTSPVSWPLLFTDSVVPPTAMLCGVSTGSPTLTPPHP